MKYRTMTLLMTCFFSSQPLYAQHENKLEEITVTVRPDGFQNADHIAQAVSVLSGDELREKVGNSLGETLSQELGVSASDFGQGASRPIIRGLGGARVSIMQDGIGSLDVSSISVDHPTTIEPGQAEQIEILRGPATLLYGSGAFGGLVNVSTRRLPKTFDAPFSASIDLRYNTNADNKSVAMRADGAHGILAMHFDALTRNAGNYDAQNQEVQNSFVESEDRNIGLSLGNNDSFLGFSVGQYASEFGVPQDPNALDEAISIDQNQDRLDITGRLSSPIKGIRSAKFRLAYVDYEHTEFENPGEPGTEFFNNEWESRLEFHHQALAAWNGTFGLQHRHRRFNSIGAEAFVPESELDSTGIFILEDTDIRNWHFEIGARVEFQSVEDLSINTKTKYDHSIYSVSFGAIYDFDQSHAMSLSATRAQRAPSIEELLAGGPHLATATFEEGNRTLQEETSNNIELSLRKTTASLNWTMNIYLNYIEDFIYQNEQDENADGRADFVDEDRRPGGELLLTNFEQHHAVFYGLEMEAQYELFNNQRGVFSVRAWGDWVRAELTNSENLARIPPARLGLNLEYNFDNWHADLDISHNFKQTKHASLESETGSFNTMNIGLGYSTEVDSYSLDLFVRATNLLDDTIRRHTSFLKQRAPLPGRSVILGLSAGF